MRDYLLFIDTETSGLPEKWDEPYSNQDNWPCVVQLAWIIYTKDRQEVKTENYYIKESDFDIAPSACDIHGITPAFLQKNGESRQKIMQLLHDDLLHYKPLVVGHFMQLDYHMVGAEFYRTGLENPLEHLPSFCTMLASVNYTRNPRLKYLRLGNLYNVLFGATLQQQHDALVDARATADCFFEMVRRGDVDNKTIAQQKAVDRAETADKRMGCSLLFLVFFMFSILVSYWL